MLACLLSSSAAPAQDSPPPFGDVPVRLEAARGVLRVGAAGLSTSGAGPAARRAARARAEARAARALHDYVDAALARVGAGPEQATSVHEALRQALRVVGTRPLSDGTVVVVMEAEVEPLRAAWEARGLPWSR